MKEKIEKEKRVDRFHFVTMDSLKQEEQNKQNLPKKDAILPAEVIPYKEPEVKTQKEETSSKKVLKEETEKSKGKWKFHISFEHRIVIAAMSIFFTFIAACLLVYNAIHSNQGKLVTYQETNIVQYAICLFSTNECTSQEQEYLADDTHIIKSEFQYHADFSEKIQYQSEYYVKAFFKVYDLKKEKEIIFKIEDLLFEQTKTSSMGNKVLMNANVEVDYQKYYRKFLEIEKDYQEDEISSDLEVVFYLKGQNGTRKISSLLIPMNSNSYRVITNVVPKTEGKIKVMADVWNTYTILNALIASILVGICLFILYKTVKLILAVTTTRSKYQQKLLKILREYDRIIVIARGGYESNFVRDVVKVSTFEELLEIKRSLQKPIIYSKINDEKSEFIVEDEEKLYKFTMKESDV